jgi:protein-disulfide isomerase
MKNFLPVVIIIALVVISGYFLLTKTKIPVSQKQQTNQREQAVEVQTGNLPPLGNPQAPIKIIEFGDFLCPFCARTVSELYPQIENLINQGKVVLYFRDFVVHPQATIIHNAARCANEQGKYWEFNKNIFQKFLNGVDTSKKENLLSLGKELNLDLQSFEKCLDENRYNQKIQNDFQAGVSAGVEGTPTFFINGQKVEGLNIPKVMSTINKFNK